MVKLRTQALAFLLSSLMLLSGHVASAPEEDGVLTFGVVPQQASEKLAMQWLPLMRHLSAKTGYKIQFATAPNIPEFEKRLAAGEYDFAYMNPYHFTVFNENPGYRATARQKNHVIRGIIVVAASLEVESLEDLAGADLAFPAPKAFAATLITRAFLDDAAPGYTATFVNSHDSVYRAVASGLFNAGGGIVRTFNEMSPEIKNELEVLWLSPGYTGHAFAVNPEVAEEVAEAVQQALVEVAESEAGANILRGLGMNALQTAIDSDWDDVRALGLDQP
ncbi:phosphate/phosphite/phosphonate ABC transporter substrate-binding protein [Methylophaga sp.]|uniref:phosphate/phosphite/phosphonate ABC transporter substrate-binding protein n=1 Tax=Methylophaga sp. TaxID=2024840 RepID=UPI003A8D7D68